jgi:hypothetical protein
MQSQRIAHPARDGSEAVESASREERRLLDRQRFPGTQEAAQDRKFGDRSLIGMLIEGIVLVVLAILTCVQGRRRISLLIAQLNRCAAAWEREDPPDRFIA